MENFFLRGIRALGVAATGSCLDIHCLVGRNDLKAVGTKVDKSARLGFYGIVVGLGIFVTGIGQPIAFPASHIVGQILFWGGVFCLVEALMLILDDYGLSKTPKKIRFAVHAVAPVVLFGLWMLHYEGSPSANLQARFTFTNPPEIWMDKPVSVTEIVENKTSDDVVFDNFVVTEIQTNSKYDDPYSSSNICLNHEMSDLRMVDEANPAGAGPITAKDTYGNFISNHTISNMTINGTAAGSGNAILPTNALEVLAGQISIFPNDWGKFNTVVLCPTVLTENVSQGRVLYMCPGIIDYRLPEKDYEEVLGMAPSNFAKLSVDHAQIQTGEIMAWPDAGYTLDGKMCAKFPES